MAEQNEPILWDSVSGGIGNDKYLTVPNGCYDGEGIDIRRGKRVVLSTHNKNEVVVFPNESNITTMGASYYASDNGYIYSPSGEELYKFKDSSAGDLSNYIQTQIDGDATYLWFGDGYVSKGNLSSGRSDTWVYNASYWTKVGTTYEHVTGNTGAMVGDAASAGEYYRVKFTVSGLTAGSFDITIGNATPVTVSANGDYTLWFTAANNDGPTITPTSDFDGTIDTQQMVWESDIVEKYITLEVGLPTCPVLLDGGIVFVGAGRYLDAIGPDGILESQFILPIGTEIVSITKIDDQFIIWSRDSQGSIVYYWDGKGSDPQRSIYWYNEIIQQVVNQGNYHLVFTGGDNGIKKVWKSNGNSKVMLYQIRAGQWDDTTGNVLVPPMPIYWGAATNNYTNNIESFGDLVFIPGYNKVLVYGKRVPGFPDAMFADYALKTEQIYSMYAYDGEIFVSYESDTNECSVINWKLDNYEDVQDTSDDYYFGDRGYISLNPIMYLSSDYKNAVKSKLGMKTPTNTFMNMYYAIDREVDRYTFVVDETINNVTVDPIVGDTYKVSTNSVYEVTKVTKFLNYMFIETHETTIEKTPRVSQTLTKIAGTGDATITYVDFHNYRHLDKITSTTELKARQWIRAISDEFSEIQFRFELLTRDGKYTPEINDISLFYDPIPNG